MWIGFLSTLAEITEVDELRTTLDIRLYDAHVLDSMKTVKSVRSVQPLVVQQMLRILQELRAQAMILSMPLHGSWWDYARVSPAARRQYYVRVRELGARYGVRTVVLDDLESDHCFFVSPVSSTLGPLPPRGRSGTLALIPGCRTAVPAPGRVVRV